MEIEKDSLASLAEIQPIVDFIVYPPESSGVEPFPVMLKRRIGEIIPLTFYSIAS
jgi:hypothetical protein